MQNENLFVEVKCFNPNGTCALFISYIVPIAEKYHVYSQRLEFDEDADDKSKPLPFYFSTDNLEMVLLYLQFVFTEYDGGEYFGYTVYTCSDVSSLNYDKLELYAETNRNVVFYGDLHSVDDLRENMNKLILFKNNVDIHTRGNVERHANCPCCNTVCPCDFTSNDDEPPPLIPVDASGNVLDPGSDKEDMNMLADALYDVVFVAN